MRVLMRVDVSEMAIVDASRISMANGSVGLVGNSKNSKRLRLCLI